MNPLNKMNMNSVHINVQQEVEMSITIAKWLVHLTVFAVDILIIALVVFFGYIFVAELLNRRNGN